MGRWREHRKWAKVFGLSEGEAKSIDMDMDFLSLRVGGEVVELPHDVSRRVTHEPTVAMLIGLRHAGAKGILYALAHLVEDGVLEAREKKEWENFERDLERYRRLKKILR